VRLKEKMLKEGIRNPEVKIQINRWLLKGVRVETILQYSITTVFINKYKK